MESHTGIFYRIRTRLRMRRRYIIASPADNPYCIWDLLHGMTCGEFETATLAKRSRRKLERENSRFY